MVAKTTWLNFVEYNYFLFFLLNYNFVINIRMVLDGFDESITFCCIFFFCMHPQECSIFSRTNTCMPYVDMTKIKVRVKVSYYVQQIRFRILSRNLKIKIIIK